MSGVQLGRRVVCGMSGGVDSAVAAYLLLKKGFEVIGVFMKNWDTHDESGTCLNGESDLEDAKSICHHLKIELIQVSFVKEYWNEVFSSLLHDYEIGLTPNPDVLCNRFVKFGAFYRYAFEKLDAHAIATGHYARTSFGPFLENYRPNKNVHLKCATDPTKDQTLFLSQISQESLRKTMFPIGTLYKQQVRKIAKAAGMESVSAKKDSTGICFVGNRKFTDFIDEYIPDKRGPFVCSETNKVLGWHKGVHHWTIGQRCKLGGFPDKYFVLDRDPATQIILIGRQNNSSLFSNSLTTLPPHWISNVGQITQGEPFTCMFRFQQVHWAIPCQFWPLQNQNGGLQIVLSLPTRAVTPGQYAVFYSKGTCIGSAQIQTKSVSKVEYLANGQELNRCKNPMQQLNC